MLSNLILSSSFAFILREMLWNSVYRFHRHKQLSELVDRQLVWVCLVKSVLGIVVLILNHLQILLILGNSYDFGLHVDGDVHLLVHVPDCLRGLQFIFQWVVAIDHDQGEFVLFTLIESILNYLLCLLTGVSELCHLLA